MGWYVVILLNILLLGVLSKYIYINRKNNFDIVFAGSCFILFYFAAFRSINVGADTYNYSKIFHAVSQIDILQLHKYASENGQEYGYVIYNKLVSLFSDSPQMIIFTNSLILIIALFIFLKRESTNPWLSIVIYITFGYYQTTLNMTPSAIASLIAFCGIKYIIDRKFLKFFLVICFAMIFHISAFVFLPVYFLTRIKLSRKKFAFFLVVGYISSFLYDYIIRFLYGILPFRYQSYLETGRATDALILIFYIIVILFCFILFRKTKIEGAKMNLLMWVVLIDLIANCFALQEISFGRLAYLFMPGFFIIIPQFIDTIKSRKKKDMITVLFVTIFFIEYICRLSINNIGLTMPYNFFWN